MGSSSNSINITACDNEMYLIAYAQSGDSSYQLAHVQSGNDNTVNVTITIEGGDYYAEPPTLNGVNGPINTTYVVYVPSDTYTVAAVGINWGVLSSFAYSVNSGPIVSGNPSQTGVVWYPAGTMITVEPDTNIPIINTVQVSSAPTPLPAGLQLGFENQNETTATTCDVIGYNGLTYWAFSYHDNREALSVCGYDANNDLREQINVSGTRYLWQITEDPTAQTVTFYGQLNQTVPLAWSDL